MLSRMELYRIVVIDGILNLHWDFLQKRQEINTRHPDAFHTPQAAAKRLSKN
jgi:hypothetical protein